MSERIQLLVSEYALKEGASLELSSREVLWRRYREWQAKRRLHASIKKLESQERSRLRELERMINQQQRLIRQINSLKTVRRMMGSWHTLHVPLGITLFSAITIHIVASIYFGGI